MQSTYDVIIIEGPDRTGKDTQIQKIRDTFISDRFQVLHYGKPPKFANVYDCMNYQKEIFKGMWQMITASMDGVTPKLILNRSHLGEAVYSRYRNYSGDYVFYDEEARVRALDPDRIALILLVPEPEVILSRNDGQSFYQTREQAKNEVDWFEEAYEKCALDNKYRIDVAGKNIDQIASEIKDILS